MRVVTFGVAAGFAFLSFLLPVSADERFPGVETAPPAGVEAAAIDVRAEGAAIAFGAAAVSEGDLAGVRGQGADALLPQDSTEAVAVILWDELPGEVKKNLGPSAPVGNNAVSSSISGSVR